jgi:ribosome-associated toxin RatA of RatAB toxin-antitoxin module
MITCVETHISKPIADVYHVAEQYPLFVRFYKKKEILDSNETNCKVRISSTFFGLTTHWEGAATKNKNHSILWLQTKGLLKGLTVDWLFKSINNSETEVTLKAEFVSYNKLFDFLAKKILIEKTLKKVVLELKKATYFFD